jgi:hypothetical protein
MRFLHPSLGLTALVAAFAVGLRTGEDAPSPLSSQSGSTPSPSFQIGQSEQPRKISVSRTLQPREQLPDPRLEELTRTLSLSKDQQTKIHPAVIRATFGYDPEKPCFSLANDSPLLLGPPMTRADFEDALFAILDVEQQLDYAASVTQKEAWWQSVISRLEADLENQTSPSGHLSSESEPAPSQGRNRQLQLPPVTD